MNNNKSCLQVLKAHLLTLVLLLSSLTTFAQKEIELNEVHISGQRRLKDTGLEKTTLDSTALHTSIANSMADILAKNSTLFIKHYGRATESTAEFRGTSSSHTQVTWNGMRINSPMLGTVDFSYIPGFLVDEATLLHGASSLIATSGGLGGAIEMRTLPVKQEGIGLQYIQGIGSYHTYDQFLRFNYANEHWSISTRVSYAKSKNDFTYTNYDKKVDVRDEQGNIIRSYHPKEKNKSGYFDDVHLLQDAFYNDLEGNQYGISAWYSYSLRGLPFLSVDYKDNYDFTNEHRRQAFNGVFSWKHIGKEWTTTTKGGFIYQNIGYNYFTTREEINTDITHSRSVGNTAFLQADAEWMPRSNWLITAAAAVYYNHVRSWDRSPYHIGDNYNTGRPEYNLCLSGKWRPTERFTLSALVREEGYQKDWIVPIPAFFADLMLYRPWNLVWKVSVSRNYRYPNMDDLYFQPGGNPDLQPEKGFTYDGGIELQRSKKRYTVKANTTVFDSYITDWILWIPNTKGYWQPSNVKKVHNYGIESTAEIQVNLGRKWVTSLVGNFAYTPSINKGEQANSNDASYGKQLCYVPRISANINYRISWAQWTLHYTWCHYSERFTTTSNEVNYITGRLKPYYMSDISLEKQFQWKHVHTSVKAVVNNLLGTEYVTVLSRPMAGRNFEVFVELKPQWKRLRQ